MVQEAIRDGDLTQGAVLVVLVPAREANLAEFRDYIVESLSMGVLVLGPGVTYSVERFPALGGMLVKRQEPPEQSGPPMPPKTSSQAREKQAKEKQVILERLKAYREQHGLGCLPQLARLGGAVVTTEVLRDALTGAVKLPLHTWRAIGKALDKAEQEGANGKSD